VSKISKSQAESFREIAAASVNSFIELGATKDEEAKLKKQITALFNSGMTKTDLDYATRSLARDKDEKYIKSLKYVRKIFGI
jgi:hypothetical protein